MGALLSAAAVSAFSRSVAVVDRRQVSFSRRRSLGLLHQRVQKAGNALSVYFYPRRVALDAWLGLGIGRLGAIVGPLAGRLFARGLSWTPTTCLRHRGADADRRSDDILDGPLYGHARVEKHTEPKLKRRRRRHEPSMETAARSSTPTRRSTSGRSRPLQIVVAVLGACALSSRASTPPPSVYRAADHARLEVPSDTLGTILTADMVGLCSLSFLSPFSARFGHKRMVSLCTTSSV